LLYAYTSPKNYHINVFVIFIFIYIDRLFYCVFHLFTNIDKIPQKNQRDIQNMLVGMSEKVYKEMVKEMMQHPALVSTCYQLILWGHLHASDPVIVQCCVSRLWILHDDVDGLWFIVTWYMYWHMLLMSFPWVCRKLDRLWMPMASTNYLRLQIESGSGLCWVWVFILRTCDIWLI